MFSTDMSNHANTHREAVAQNAGQRQKGASTEENSKISIWRPHTEIGVQRGSAKEQ